MQHKWQKISKFKTSNESPGFLLWKTQLTWKRLIEKSLITHGLTHSQFVILASTEYLTKDGKHVTQVELAKHTAFDINTASQVLRSLEKNGLIIRISKPGNEKSKYPHLTELGYQTLGPAIKTVESVDDVFFSGLAPSELDGFKHIAAKLIANK